MIAVLIYWNLLSIDDICFFQKIHYQKDRYLDTMDLTIKDLIGMILLSGIVILLEAYDIAILYYLVILMMLPAAIKNTKVYQEKLKITKRIMRLFALIIILDITFFCLSLVLWEILNQLLMLFMMIFHHFVFYLYIWITDPIETSIRKSYVLKAKKKCDRFEGIKIGITGSYGKTSIKNLVYDVLSMKYLCLKTRASYNNEMGITKTILEEMSDQEVFICEMGADHMHEIEDLCTFVEPVIGIVSAVGPQHLSTFKSIENILHEKMKLLESLPVQGMGFFNFDNFYLHEQEMNLACEVTRVGLHSAAQLKAIHLVCDHLGSQFDVMLGDHLVHFSTILLGEHNILNCLFAIGVGYYLKVDPVLIQMAIACAKPVEHRMELKPFYKGMCIDNAYNSNPESARISLEVLKMMPGRHLLVTPGFIDLGELHGYYSQVFGTQMAFCEKIVLVGECSDIVTGLKEAGYDMENVAYCATMKDALILMRAMIEEGDTMLIENDIPEVLMNASEKKA